MDSDTKLKKLLRKKQRCQDVEEELVKYKKIHAEYSKKVRSTAQTLSEMKKYLFDLI